MKFSGVTLIFVFLNNITPCDGKRIGERKASYKKAPEASKTHRFLQYFLTQITTEEFNIKVETPEFAFGREVTTPWKFPNPWEIMGDPSTFAGYTLGNLTALGGLATVNPAYGNVTNNVAFCFSPNTIVDMLDEGGETAIKTQMKDIEVGDRVLTASGDYETIYSFSHRHPTKPTEFVQIFTGENSATPVELTKGHMVFVEGKSNPIPASTVTVGNKLQNVHRGSSVVTKIDTVTRNGLYAPLTNSGTVVVDNGIVASAYSTLPGLFSEKEHLEIAGLKIFSHQSFYDTLLTPYRYFCTDISLDLCRTSSERDVYTWIGTALYGKWMKQSDMVKNVSLSTFLSFLFLARVLASTQYGVIIAIAAFTFGAIHNAKSKKQKLC